MKRTELRRRTPLARGEPLERTRMKPKRNAKRRAAEWPRVYGSGDRVKFIAREPCVCCGKFPTKERPSHNHHVWADGTSRKGPYTAIVPLCAECHDRYHRVGKLSLLQQSRLRVREYDPRGRRLVFTPCDTWEDAARLVDRLCREEGIAVP